MARDEEFIKQALQEAMVALEHGDVPIGAVLVTAVVWASRGTLKHIVSQFNEVTGNWRAFFDLIPEGGDPIELRCFLELGDVALSETWSYQWSE